MNGHYNNTLRDVIGNLTAAKADIDWMARNFISTAPNVATLYGTSQISNANFPIIAKYAADKKIRLGKAYSAESELDAVIAFNNRQTDPAIKFTHVVTEYEPYRDARGYDYLTNLYKNNAARLKAAGLKVVTYMGWPMDSYWGMIVKYSDEINLHCYRTPAQMTKSKVWDYVEGRLKLIAAAAKAQNKVMPVNILYSSEAAFAGDWYKTHTFWNGHQLFMQGWDSWATADMKTWLRATNCYVFVTKESKKVKA